MTGFTRFTDRVSRVEPFRVVEVLTRARQLEAGGQDIIHMEVGEPAFGLAEPISAAAKSALDEGHTLYSPATGIPELRDAISRWYRETLHVDVPAHRIMVTPGASGALLLISALLIERGRGMLMADPGYPCNRNFLRLFGGEEQLVAVGPEENFQLTEARARSHWRANTVGMLVASPSNPTGTLISQDELRKLYQLCSEREGAMVVDEIYQQLVYHSPVSTVLSITDEAFVINSFSKYFGMTGWRLGWLVAPEAAVQAMDVLAQNLFISMSTPAQYAALAGFGDDCQAELKRRVEQLAQRRDYLLPALRDLGFTIECEPQGAFYIYANIRSVTALESQEFCLNMLEEQGVAITPGTDFGYHNASDYVRFSYTTELSRLEQAVERLSKALAR